CVCFNQTADGSLLLIRGIRYVDALVRTDAGWRIRHRSHEPLWESRQAALPPPISAATHTHTPARRRRPSGGACGAVATGTERVPRSPAPAVSASLQRVLRAQRRAMDDA